MTQLGVSAPGTSNERVPPCKGVRSAVVTRVELGIDAVCSDMQPGMFVALTAIAPAPLTPPLLCYLIGIRPRVRFTSRVFSLTVLGSGSAGNCSLISTDQCRLLVDAGFSARQIARRLEAVGVRPESLDGILITHEHSDHVAGLEIFCRRFCIPIYANPLTAETLRRGSLADFPRWNLFATGAVFSIKNIEIQSFYVPHDAVDPTAFVFTADEGSIGFLTDLGYAPNLALERVRLVDTLMIETNHDERMLQEDTRRPWSVKQRILSRHGHLSNDAAAKLVASIAGDRLRVSSLDTSAAIAIAPISHWDPCSVSESKE